MAGYLYTITRHGQATQASNRAQGESLVPQDYASGVSSNPQSSEASWPIHRGICTKEIDRVSGPAECYQHSAEPNSKHGGLDSMPQAPFILSLQQRSALESAYSCFRGARAFLESIEARLQADEKLTSQNLRELAALCEHKLVEVFPELHAWLVEWTRGGVQ